jgi:YD repeat-containing protein
MSYDAHDRVTRIIYQNDQGMNASRITSTYDQNGNLASRSDATGTTTYAYDPRNQQTSQTLPASRTTTYTYDQVGNLTLLGDAGGTVTYVYEDVNLLEVLREPAGTETAFEYDTNNRRVPTVYPNGSSQRVDYDDSERLKAVRSRRNGTGRPRAGLRLPRPAVPGHRTRARSSFREAGLARCCGGQHRPRHRNACPLPSGQEAR